MRFASIGGQSNYAQAGKAVARDAEKALDVTRKNSVDFGGLAQAGMEVRSKEKIAATKAGAYVKRAEIAADKTEKLHAAKMKGAKAGVMRKAGGLIALGVGGLAEKSEKRDYSLYDKKIAGMKEKNDADRATMAGIDTSGKKVETPASAPAANTGGTGASNVSTTAASGGSGVNSSDAWSKWAKVIKNGEGTVGDKGYTTMFTGAQFSDMSKHPARINSANGLSSDAAGAYQFLSTTYNPAAKALGITDFSPQSQEKVGKYLAQQRGLQTDKVFTDKQSFLKELDKIAPEWASMPTIKTGTSYYGQGGLTPDQAWNIYNS
jgi:muramidase (phage lysozyme)